MKRELCTVSLIFEDLCRARASIAVVKMLACTNAQSSCGCAMKFTRTQGQGGELASLYN